MIPLVMVGVGETVTVQRVTGKDATRLHLAELGFVEGAKVTIVNEVSGNLILQVKDSRVALNKDMAMRIMA